MRLFASSSHDEPGVIGEFSNDQAARFCQSDIEELGYGAEIEERAGGVLGARYAVRVDEDVAESVQRDLGGRWTR